MRIEITASVWLDGDQDEAVLRESADLSLDLPEVAVTHQQYELTALLGDGATETLRQLISTLRVRRAEARHEARMALEAEVDRLDAERDEAMDRDLPVNVWSAVPGGELTAEQVATAANLQVLAQMRLSEAVAVGFEQDFDG
jgi:hypothetical protein